MDFSVGKFHVKVFKPKRTRNGLKLKLFKFGGKSVDGAFPIF